MANVPKIWKTRVVFLRYTIGAGVDLPHTEEETEIEITATTAEVTIAILEETADPPIEEEEEAGVRLAVARDQGLHLRTTAEEEDGVILLRLVVEGIETETTVGVAARDLGASVVRDRRLKGVARGHLPEYVTAIWKNGNFILNFHTRLDLIYVMFSYDMDCLCILFLRYYYRVAIQHGVQTGIVITVIEDGMAAIVGTIVGTIAMVAEEVDLLVLPMVPMAGPKTVDTAVSELEWSEQYLRIYGWHAIRINPKEKSIISSYSHSMICIFVCYINEFLCRRV